MGHWGCSGTGEEVRVVDGGGVEVGRWGGRGGMCQGGRGRREVGEGEGEGRGEGVKRGGRREEGGMGPEDWKVGPCGKKSCIEAHRKKRYQEKGH